MKGVVYIDGSAYISNNSMNRYVGLATLYLSGTFRIDGNAQLCGGVAPATATSPRGTRTPTSSASSRTATTAPATASYSRTRPACRAASTRRTLSSSGTRRVRRADGRGHFKLENTRSRTSSRRSPQCRRLAGQHDGLRRAAAPPELFRIGGSPAGDCHAFECRFSEGEFFSCCGCGSITRRGRSGTRACFIRS